MPVKKKRQLFGPKFKFNRMTLLTLAVISAIGGFIIYQARADVASDWESTLSTVSNHLKKGTFEDESQFRRGSVTDMSTGVANVKVIVGPNGQYGVPSGEVKVSVNSKDSPQRYHLNIYLKPNYDEMHLQVFDRHGNRIFNERKLVDWDQEDGVKVAWEYLYDLYRKTMEAEKEAEWGGSPSDRRYIADGEPTETHNDHQSSCANSGDAVTGAETCGTNPEYLKNPGCNSGQPCQPEANTMARVELTESITCLSLAYISISYGTAATAKEINCEQKQQGHTQNKMAMRQECTQNWAKMEAYPCIRHAGENPEHFRERKKDWCNGWVRRITGQPCDINYNMPNFSLPGALPMPLYVDYATSGPAFDYVKKWDDWWAAAGCNYFAARMSETLDKQCPTRPQLSKVKFRGGQGVLNWSRSIDNAGAVQYIVYRNGEEIATTAQTTYALDDIDNKSPDVFHVRAQDSSGFLSASSNYVSPRDSKGILGGLSAAVGGWFNQLIR